MTEEPEPRPAITKVWAKNFRSIEYAELELDPLTVLVGPNASGKSNLLDVIGLLSDAVRDGLETAITRRGGIDSIGRRSPTGATLGPELGLRFEQGSDALEYTFELAKRRGGEYRVKREAADLGPSGDRKHHTEVEITNKRLTKPRVRAVSSRRRPRNSVDNSPLDVPAWVSDRLKEQFDDQTLLLVGDSLTRFSIPLHGLAFRETGQARNAYLDLGFILRRASSLLSGCRLYHIFPNSIRDPKKMADSHPLTSDGENLASTLRDMILKKNRFLPDLRHALNYAAPGISGLRVSRAGSFQVVELNREQETENGKGSWFDLSFESDGTIRLLAMLTALFQEPSLPLIGLEEPELAIHPGAMAVLAETMVEASLRGQIVVTTHSPDLIDRMPVNSIRAVSAESGSTKVGRVDHHQMKSVTDGLFSPGELHSMEGLIPSGLGD